MERDLIRFFGKILTIVAFISVLFSESKFSMMIIVILGIIFATISWIEDKKDSQTSGGTKG